MVWDNRSEACGTSSRGVAQLPQCRIEFTARNPSAPRLNHPFPPSSLPSGRPPPAPPVRNWRQARASHGHVAAPVAGLCGLAQLWRAGQHFLSALQPGLVQAGCRRIGQRLQQAAASAMLVARMRGRAGHCPDGPAQIHMPRQHAQWQVAVQGLGREQGREGGIPDAELALRVQQGHRAGPGLDQRCLAPLRRCSAATRSDWERRIRASFTLSCAAWRARLPRSAVSFSAARSVRC
jgi:hypothetical protein